VTTAAEQRLIALRQSLAVDRVARRRDTGLVERNRHQFMHAVIADISQRQKQRVNWLPLNIEAPILRVRQLVVRIIAAKQKCQSALREVRAARASAQLRLIVDQRVDAGETSRRSRKRSRAERSAQAARSRAAVIDRQRERLFGGNSKRPADAQPGARRKFCEEFAAVVVHTVARADRYILQESGSPSDPNARSEPPLAAVQRRIAFSFSRE